MQDVDTSYNYGVSAALIQDFGFFDLAVRTGGSTDILEFSVLGGSTDVSGDRRDCLTFAGGSGSGLAHLPIRLAGGVSIEWSFGGAYVPPGGSAPPAEVQLQILCVVRNLGSPTFGTCNDFDLRWSASEAIDATFELVFPFTFGAPITLLLQTDGYSRLIYSSTGSTGSLDGFAEAGLRGELQPLYVTDLGGSPLPGATLTATSGFDYLTAPEVEGSSVVALLVLTARMWRRVGAPVP